MAAQKPNHTTDLERATEGIRQEYIRRKAHPKAGPGHAMFESRLRHYDALFEALGCRPIGSRPFLDMGCANGAWLELCCQRWGAIPENCVGVDLRRDLIECWRQEHPDSKIRLICQPAHELDFADHSFDLVHHSMMLSSIPYRPLRDCIAQAMWRLLRPGGYIVSYDFWTNPTNRQTVGIRHAELQRLFPQARLAFARTITVAPPISRLLARWGDRLVLGLEKLRVLNTHYLVALARDA
jgi:SAM-dependent methyltransferase